MKRTTLIEAEREGLRAIAAAKLNPPKQEIESDTRREARQKAAALGHDLGPITAKGADRHLVGRCRRRGCIAAVVFRPQDVMANESTGDFYGGTAVTQACKGD